MIGGMHALKFGFYCWCHMESLEDECAKACGDWRKGNLEQCGCIEIEEYVA